MSEVTTSVHDEPEALAPDLRSHAEQVGAAVRAALEELVLEVSGPSPRPTHLINRLGLDKTLAGRIVQTARAPDALTALSRCPAPNGLGILMRAVQGANVRPDCLARAAAAVAEFEELLSRFPRGRADLDAAISGWLPESREQGERTARQAAFKSMSFLLGYQSDVTLGCTILRPGADGNSVDVAYVSGLFGLRRLRVGEPLSLFGIRYYPTGDTRQLPDTRTLAGRPIHEASCLLDDFCMPRQPRVDIVQTKDQRLFVLPADQPGINVPVTILAGHRTQGSWRRYASQDQREEWQTILTRRPTRILLNDTFIHQDVYPGVEPVVTTHMAGMSPLPARERGPGFSLDEIHLARETGWVRSDLRDIGTGEIPRYPELIDSVFKLLGEDFKKYRIHRLRMNYPVSGIVTTRWFALPERP